MLRVCKLLCLVLVSLPGACWAQAVPGLGMLLPPGDPLAGEMAARALAGSLGASDIRVPDSGAFTIPEGVRVLWWHCEQAPLPAAMLRAQTKEAVLAWVGAGHGLFLSGTALAYLGALGVEPAGARLAGGGGSDSIVAGVSPGAFSRHPIYSGLAGSGPIMLASAGYPGFSDFWDTGGPFSGIILGEAHPNAGENPLTEHAHGRGRLIAMGWRLPYYALRDNAYRSNLERLTVNILAYLARGEWYGVVRDGRGRRLWMALELVNPGAMRLAVADLTQSFPERYTRGAEYLRLLDRLPDVKAALQREDEGAAAEAERLLAQLRRAMLDNPLLDFGQLLVVKRSESNLGLPQNWQSNSSLPRSGFDNEIAVLSPVRPDGEIRTLYRPDRDVFVGDVDLDFDASRMVFSMPASNGQWQLFEMAADGSGLQQVQSIQEPDVDNYDACYLPDGNLLFTSTAPFIGVPCVTGSDHVSNLYRLDRDTGAVRQLGFEQDHDWCPTVLPNGRVLYLRWEYADIPHYVSRILFSMNPDGTNQAEFYGSNSYWPNSLFYARPLPGSPTRFVGVVGGHHDNPRMGELVLFDAARGQREATGAIQRIPGRGQPVQPTILDGLTAGSWPKYLHPYPLSDKYFLTACKPTPGSRWGIYLADVFDNLTLIREVEGYALLEPIPLRATPRPPVIPNRVDPTRRDALVYLADIYRGPGLAGVPRGTISKLRLLTYHFAYHGMGGQVNRVGLDGPWDVKRVIGTVPVESDGSAFFRVPANTPISVQPLDDTGQALQLMRTWMTAMPGETLSCVGCHEPQGTPPPVRRAAALNRPPRDIEPWYGPTRGFSFAREVQPVLDRHCLSCHDGSQLSNMPDLRALPPVHPPGPEGGYRDGSLFTPSYLALKRYVRNATIESDMHLLMPGEFAADTTRLVQMLRRGHHGVQLDPGGWDRLITWIDLNTPAHGTWSEIVGADRVTHYRDRRREMMRRYAGRDEDPEAIIATSYRPEPVKARNTDGAAPRAVTCSDWPFSAAEAGRRQQSAGTRRRTLDLGGGVQLELVRVPSGEFVVGDAGGGSAGPVRITEPFWVGKTEVTNAQFARFDATHDSRLEGGDFLQFGVEDRGYSVNLPEQPVCRVSWERAMHFCRWLSQLSGEAVTLPTAAQWEWACRAGSAAPLWWGGTDTDFASYANLADASLQRVDNFAPWGLPYGAIYDWRPAVTAVNDGHRVSAPVGAYEPNPWGLLDMHGNVAEWTLDGHGDGRVACGGSWYSRPAEARATARQTYPYYRGVYDVGFRVVVRVR